MIRSTMIVAAAALFAATGCETTATTGTTASVRSADAGVSTTETSDGEICKTQEVTGSRISRRRVCKSAEEWRDDANEAGRAMRNLNDTAGAPIEKD